MKTEKFLPVKIDPPIGWFGLKKNSKKPLKAIKDYEKADRM